MTRQSPKHYKEWSPWGGVNKLIKEKIEEGKTDQEVLEEVQLEFPENKLSMPSVAWYRRKVAKES